MSKNLVIVESPTKAKTIGRFLGNDYKVVSSFGHVRDLPKSKLGVDVDNDFTPQYLVPMKAKKVVTELKSLAKGAKEIYLATDEDREGEAIAWHLISLLNPKPDKVKRIAFHEITETAIKEAVEHPRELDIHMVDAQQARRILDRLVGYELSPFLWKKVAKGLSAGRVQSAAVRLIVEREREISNFVKQEYWTIKGLFNKEVDEFEANLIKHNEQLLDKFAIPTTEAAQTLTKEIEQVKKWSIVRLDSKETKRQPPPPYTTSSLQQDANRKLGMTAKQTMMLAQKLYEGIELGEGSVGLITYMRTDAVNLAEKFLAETQDYIKENFDKAYLTGPRRFANKSKNAQEAHEAIRPTEIFRAPEAVKEYLSPQEYKLYNLIWSRTLASQLPEARWLSTVVDITSEPTQFVFRANGLKMVFDGFLKVLRDNSTDNLLPALNLNDELGLKKVTPEQHFTEPPARYSEASLVKALENFGIGRPSTYAPTISTIIDRGYIEREEKRLKPTELATLVNDVLVEHFPQIVDFQFTAKMEDDLDQIAAGSTPWVPIIRNFYHPFKGHLNSKYMEVSKKDLTETETDEVCEKCSSPMVVKIGRFGKFLACSNYPNCKNTKQIGKDGKVEAPETTDEKCPDCGADMVVKRGRFGKFLACSRYPDCKGIKKIQHSTGVKCPQCNEGDIVEKRSKRGRNFYSCSRYPDCKFALWSKPTGEKCQACGSLMVYSKNNTAACSNKDCSFTKSVE